MLLFVSMLYKLQRRVETTTANKKDEDGYGQQQDLYNSIDVAT